MLEFDDVLIEALSARTLVVAWAFAPTMDLVQNYRVSISRSLSPEDGFVTIATGLRANQFVFLDTDPPELSRWATLYFKVTVEKVDASGAPIPGTATESSPRRLRQQYAPVALHIIRARSVYYRHLKLGRESLVYRRRTSGQTCPSCYDPVEGRTTKHSCPLCYGTGRVGGYYPPQRVLIQFRPSERRNNVGSTISEQTYVMAQMGHFPMLSPRDVVFEINTGKWYIVNTVSPKEVERVTTSQQLQLRELNPQAKEQDLALPSSIANDVNTSYLVAVGN